MTRHLWKWFPVLLVLLAADVGIASGQEKLKEVTLKSSYLNPKVPIAAYPQGILSFTLKVKVDEKGEGKGDLILDPNTATYNEVGDVAGVTEIAPAKLTCSLKFIKKGKVKAGPPGLEEDWLIYQIEGPKITTLLFLVTPNKEFTQGRLVIKYKDGKVAYVVGMHTPPPPQPCHPGCFPVGTLIHTPQGVKPIESLAAGSVVTTVRPDGATVNAKIQTVFVTDNDLLKVETDNGFILTTQTQPLCLADGGLRAAGELQPGDRILRWHDGKVQTVKVIAVTPTGRHEKVFNLILGGSEVFIAGGFLARSKPPAEAASAQPSPPALGLPTSKK